MTIKLIPQTEQEIFDDIHRIVSTHNVINNALYKQFGKFSLQYICEHYGNLKGLLHEYNKTFVANIQAPSKHFEPVVATRKHSEATKAKLRKARKLFNENTTTKNITFTKEEALAQGELYWLEYHTDFSEKEFLSANNYYKPHFHEIFKTFTAFKKLLSCWDEMYAMRLAHIREQQINRHCPTKEQILQCAQELYNTNGKLIFKDIMIHLQCTDAYIQKTVGNIKKIKEILNISTESPQDIKNKQLFESELKRIYQLAQQDNVEKFTKDYFFANADKQLTNHFMKKYYGSFAKLCNQCNIAPYQYEFTKESILKRSWELYHKYGKFDTKIQRSKEAHLPQSAIDRCFGSFNNLLREMGLELNINRGLTKQDVLADLSSIVKKYGILNEQIIINESKISLPTILKLFNGSLDNVYQELNILNNTSLRMSQIGTYCILKISEILNEEPEFEKTFDWLHRTYPLPLDGYFHNHNLAIEYDGPWHYENIKTSADKDYVFYRIANDELKDKLCAEHGVQLIRIPYTEELTTENLKNILIKNNIITK